MHHRSIMCLSSGETSSTIVNKKDEPLPLSSPVPNSWASLPEDILYMIVDKLPDLCYHLLFPLVCKEWCYNLARGRCRRDKARPMLLFPNGSGKQCIVYELHSVFEGKTNKTDFSTPDFGATTVCSSYSHHGWLARINSGSVKLVNIFCEKIASIDLPLLPEVKDGKRVCQIKGLTLSADPLLNPDSFMVIAIFDRILFLTKGGQTCWTPILPKNHEIQINQGHAVFYKGRVFYVVGEHGSGSILSLDINSLQQRQITPESTHVDKEYLVKSARGDFLWHVQFFTGRRGHIRIYKVTIIDEDDGNYKVKRVEVKSIGDEALLVRDYNQCISVVASNMSCRKNCIYSILWLDGELVWSVFDLESGIRRKFPLNLPHIPTCWISPPRRYLKN